MTSNNLTLKISLMKQIATNYFRARNVLCKKSDVLSDTNFHSLCSYIFCVLQAYTKLKSSEKSFINNEFFYGAKEEWWKSSLTKEKYKKVQVQSIDHFLAVFYEIF